MEEDTLRLAQTEAKVKSKEQEGEGAQGNVKVEEKAVSQTKSVANFFYIDDFFYWLGCKFVTCEKAKGNQQGEERAEKGDKEQEGKAAAITLPRKYY